MRAHERDIINMFLDKIDDAELEHKQKIDDFIDQIREIVGGSPILTKRKEGTDL